MQLLLKTHSLSWAESVRIALLGEGIEAELLDNASPGTLGLAGSIRLAIPDDADLGRAKALVASLNPPKSAPLPSWRWHKRAFIAFGAGIVLESVAASGTGARPSPTIELALTFAGTGLIITAVVLLIIGYRVDKRAPRRDPARLD